MKNGVKMLKKLSSAMSSLKSGKHQDATDKLCDVLKKDKSNKVALITLSDLASRSGNHKQAVSLAALAHKYHPTAKDVAMNLVSKLRQIEGSAGVSQNILEKIISEDDSFIDGHLELARIGLEQGDVTLGKLEELRRLLPNNNSNAELLELIGIFSMELGLITDAIEYLVAAHGYNPKKTSILANLGASYVGNKDLQAAIECYEKALLIDDKYTIARGGLCSIYEKMGESEKALEVLPKGMVTPEVSTAYATACKQAGRISEAIDVMTAALSSGVLNELNRRKALFLLGSLYDKDHKYKEAFECYDEANRIKRAKFSYEFCDKTVLSVQKLFSKEEFSKTAKSKNTISPIFILGMPRSGTSLVEQILATHDDIYAAGEASALGDLIPSTNNMSDISLSDVEKLKDRYLELISGDGRRITDKNPRNFMLIGMIKMLFPESKIIHCVRDPRDTCLSIYFQDFIGGHAYGYDQETLAYYYRQYLKIMLHWEELGIEMHTVKYEDMVNNCEAETRKILDFCGMAWDDKLMKFHENKRQTHTASYQQVRQPIYQSSVGRWKNYEPWIGELISGL